MVDVSQSIETLRDRIQHSETIDEADKAALLEFSNELRFRRTDYSDHRHLKLLQHLTILAGDSKKYTQDALPGVRLVDVLEDKEAAKTLVRWIHRHYDNEETNRDYRVAIRRFAAMLTDGDPDDPTELPPSIRQISATTSRNYNPMPDPASMYQWEDHILPMIEARQQPRDKALVAMSWDTGFRSGEICGLTVGDISDHRYGLTGTVNGRMGQRTVIMIPSVPYVRNWLNNHPHRDDQDAPLWCDLDAGDDLSYGMKAKILRRAAQKAAMTPPSSPTFTRMRKSSASYLAAQNVSQVHLENHHGWKRGSEVAARYIAVFSEDTEREIARAHGADVEAEESDPIAPLNCPRCRRETPREEALCVWCGQAQTQQAIEDLEEQDDRLFESSLQVEPGSRLESDLREIRGKLEQNPQLRSFLLGN